MARAPPGPPPVNPIVWGIYPNYIFCEAGNDIIGKERQADAEIEITEEMIAAGVFALSGKWPFDVAFPAGGEDEAVEVALRAALAVRPGLMPDNK